MNENKTLSYLVGGLGEKKSNNGTQYFQQDRVYIMRDIALTHPANLPSGSYLYLINERNDQYKRKQNKSG